MKTQTLIASLAAANTVLAKEPTTTQNLMPWEPVHTPKWVGTVEPEKVSKLNDDMHSLAQSVKSNKLYTSMTAVVATAIPETFKEAMSTNAKSLHKQYKTATPEWYAAIPSDIRHFMEENKKAAKSIFSKDIGEEKAHATSSGSAPKETGKNKDKDGQVKKNEADSIRIVGAATAAFIGTFGFALLML